LSRAAGIARWTAGLIVSGLFILAGADRASAQAAEDKAHRDNVQRDFITLPGIASVSAPSLAINVDATTDDKRGSVAVAVGDDSDSVTFSVTASGPLQEGTDEFQPLTLEGLPSAAAVEIAFQWFYWARGADPITTRQFCLDRLGRPDCGDLDFSGDDLRAYRRLKGLDSNPWLFTFSAAAGRTDFKFFHPSDLALARENHTDWAASLYGGRYSPALGYIAAGYEYERSWSPAGGARQICVPLGMLPALECRSAAVGFPAQDSGHVVRGQWRKFFPGGRGAVNPIVARDFTAGITSIRLPVYFFLRGNEGLAGGARFDWRSDSDASSLVVFIGTVFSLIGR
jgi:hypothetical protein